MEDKKKLGWINVFDHIATPEGKQSIHHFYKMTKDDSKYIRVDSNNLWHMSIDSISFNHKDNGQKFIDISVFLIHGVEEGKTIRRKFSFARHEKKLLLVKS